MAESTPKFNPYGVLQALDRHRVSYVVVGGFARVVQGTEETTRGIDIVPSTREENLRRLDEALREIGARPTDGGELVLDEAVAAKQPVIELSSDFGEVKVIPAPAGTRGYDDLRRKANREPLGRGVRPSVASVGDLARMLSAQGSEQNLEELRQLRRLGELERGHSRTIER